MAPAGDETTGAETGGTMTRSTVIHSNTSPRERTRGLFTRWRVLPGDARHCLLVLVAFSGLVLVSLVLGECGWR